MQANIRSSVKAYESC